MVTDSLFSPRGLRSILADPLYRWEVRRYWTWRRYLWTALAILALSAVVVAYVLWTYYARARGIQTKASPDWSAGQILMLCGSSVASVARVPLCVLAAVGAALAVAPERRSGQIEQLVLTPIEPWRFALARMAGRFRGLFLIWLAVGAVLAGALALLAACGLPALRGGGLAPQALGLRILGSGLSHLDLGLMLILDTAVGLGFSASSKSTAGAVAKACLVSLLLLPVVLWLPAFGLGALGPPAWVRSEEARQIYVVAVQTVGIVLHAGLGCGALVFFLRRARRTVTRVFDDPEALA
jgi:heme/copper-type cytochrome/quinol oxidase subunit 2